MSTHDPPSPPDGLTPQMRRLKQQADAMGLGAKEPAQVEEGAAQTQARREVIVADSDAKIKEIKARAAQSPELLNFGKKAMQEFGEALKGD